jgi:hypothetical protein
LLGKEERTVVSTPSYFFDDKIACLRTIFYPPRGFDSLLLESQYNKLPLAIQSVLDTKYIKTCLKHDYGLKNIAAVLIFYRLKPLCAPEEIQKILKDNDVSEKIINIYSLMTAEKKTKWLNLSDVNVFYLSDILRPDFLENIDNISTLNQKLNNQNITSFDKLSEFLSSENLTPEAFSLHISKLGLDNVQTIKDSMPKCDEDSNLHQAIENLKVQGQQLLDRGYPQAAKAIWAVYIQLRQKSPLTEEYINQITAPHQEILQAHRGASEIINWIKDFIRKAVFNRTQHSIFRTKTEKLIDPIHQEISNPTKTK